MDAAEDRMNGRRQIVLAHDQALYEAKRQGRNGAVPAPLIESAAS
jgi:GGDEF domain-containing protein